MLSRFWTNTLPSLLRLRSTSHPSCEPDPEQQILAELAAAVEQAMVATRSQDHTPRSPQKLGKRPAVAEDTPLGKLSRASQKQNSGQDANVDGGHQGTKRKRSNAEAEQRDTRDYTNSNSEPHRTALQQSSGNKQLTVPIAHPTDAPRLPNDGIEVRVIVNKRSPQTASLEDKKAVLPDYVPNTNTPDSTTKNDRMNRGNPLKAVKPQNEPLKYSGLQISHGSSKARHKRFDDEEPMIQPLPAHPDAAHNATKHLVNSEERDEAESDDEAPETITASTGLDRARHATEEADKAMKR